MAIQDLSACGFYPALEKALNLNAKNYLPLQPGDVSATWADNTVLKNLIGYVPNTDLEHGVIKFINWYRDYIKVNSLVELVKW